MSKIRANGIMGKLFIVLCVFALSHCAQKDVGGPINGNPGDNKCTGENCNDENNGNGGDDETDDPDDQLTTAETAAKTLTEILGQSEYDQCIATCYSTCDSEFPIATKASENATCRTECSETPWMEGGCGISDINRENCEAVRVPLNSKKVSGSLEFCMHNKQDDLVVNGSTFSFAARRSLSKVDMMPKLTLGSFRLFGLSPVGDIDSFLPAFSVVGNVMRKLPGSDGLRDKAKVIVNGTEKSWGSPGTLPFSINSLLPADRDEAKPVQFVATEVIEDGSDMDKRFKNFGKQCHMKDQLGKGSTMDIVPFEKMYRNLVKRTNCKFTVKFDIYYKAKP